MVVQVTPVPASSMESVWPMARTAYLDAAYAPFRGAVIIPITSASRRHRTFSSWDAFELPCLFTRVVVRYGEPVVVPGDADRDALEEKRAELESILQRITAEADDAART